VTDDSEEVPEYLLIKVASGDDPVSAVTEADAWRGRAQYPDVAGAGPMFGCAEQVEGRWQILGLGESAPQIARDAMGGHFRALAKEAEEAGDVTGQREFMAAAVRMDWEVVDELTVHGRDFRIIRAEQFIRTGPDGPEPPRPTDPDPAPVGKGHRERRRTKGFVINPAAATGLSDGVLRLELLPLVYKAGIVPDEVRADAARALETHPGGVLLPAEFAIAEKVDGAWEPMAGSCTTPQTARDTLSFYFREMAPRLLDLDNAECAEYARAADRLDSSRADEISVDERFFRVVRVEQLIRVGPDGPETPRPSDYDPYPPTEVQARQLREEEESGSDENDKESGSGEE
jgi:hypothetical protein